jgi:hypothetical protein
MKSAAAFLILTIAGGAYFLVSEGQVSGGDLPAAAEPDEPAPALVETERSVDRTSRGAHPVLETIPAAMPAPTTGERELTERLWMAFNSDLEDQAQLVEHERIQQLIRDDPELARELARDAGP